MSTTGPIQSYRKIQTFLFRSKIWIWILLIISISIGCHQYANWTNNGNERPSWPHETSDLEPDPNIHFGRFANGFRYILKENSTPAGRVSMHLLVEVGSLWESNREQGIAHFLEHMEFNGSTHFAPDEMVKFFQRIGMQFGPDANAHTSFTETVYDILLPQGDNQSIAEAMQVLYDYAQGALLLPEQIEKEKKIVLAEKRARDSAQYRVIQSILAFEMPKALPPRRFPIGLEETILKFDRDMLLRFYNAWYRPENMVLVVVGQFDPETTKNMVKQQFAGLEARGEKQTRPDFGTFKHQGLNTFHYFEKDIGATTVRIETIEIKEPPSDTSTTQRNYLLEALVNQIVRERLADILQQPDSIITDATIGSGYFLQHVRYSTISAECEPQKWPQALALLEQMIRQTQIYGFSTAELARTKQAFKAQLQQAQEAEDTRDSAEIAREIIRNLSDNHVIRSATQDNQLLSPMLEAFTLEEANQAFKNIWSAPHRLVMVTGNADLSDTKKTKSTKDTIITKSITITPESRIEEVYNQSIATAVSPTAAETEAAFPYLAEPAKSGAVQVYRSIEDLDIEQVEFANGVYLVMKKTPFKEGEIVVSVIFGNGKASEPSAYPGLADLTEALLNEAGFDSMDHATLEKAIAGHLAEIAFHVSEDFFQINGKAYKDDLPLLYQLLYAFFKDPGYRQDTLDLVIRRYAQQYDSALHDVQGLMQLQGETFLYGGDSRFGMASPSQLHQLSLDRIKEWFGTALNTSPIEIAVVGDIDIEKVKALTARYLGSFPKRPVEDNMALTRPGPVFPLGEKLILTVDSQIEKSLIVVAYPTEDFWDISRTRRFSLLSEVFSERLRVRIREKLGASYSPYAYNRPHSAYPGLGMFRVFLQAKPGQSAAVIAEVKAIAEELGQQPVDPDEFRRALDPTLTRIRDIRQTNDYWLRSVLSASRRYPQKLSWARNIEQDYRAITSEELRSLAAQYLVNKNAAMIVINPSPAEPTPK